MTCSFIRTCSIALANASRSGVILHLMMTVSARLFEATSDVSHDIESRAFVGVT